MPQLLVLTKNVLAEQHLQDKLHKLNFEVYCSTNVYQQLQTNNVSEGLLNHFTTVILSENISDDEVEQIMPQLAAESKEVVRKVERSPVSEEWECWQAMGINKTISLSTTTEELRETLCKLPSVAEENQKEQALIFDNYKRISFDQLALSGHEEKFLHSLVENDGEVVSRKELCQIIWDNESTRSNLVQLSCIVQRVRNKLEKQGVSGEHLERVWGTGYKLSSELLDKIMVES